MKLTFHPLDAQPLIFDINKTSLVIGRSPSCDISLVVDGISRQHCKVDFREGELFLTDLGSTNGVFIDGRRIPPKTPVRYQVFLPLSIGAIPIVTIESPDTSRAQLKQWLPADVEPARFPGSEELTRTKVVPRRPAPRRAPAPPPKSESNPLLYIIALVILVGGVWLFIQTSKDDPSVAPAPSLNNSKNVNDNGHF